jgi:hypothetical protein
MKLNYTDEDIGRALTWYEAHRPHVEALMKDCSQAWPMTGSDISHPELWKAAGWNWFIPKYGNKNGS